jgi:hypothetical protein
MASRVPFWGALLPETRTRCARVGLFLTLSLQEQAPDSRAIKNPLRSRNGFLVVDKVSEISNLELLRDLEILINFLDRDC